MCFFDIIKQVKPSIYAGSEGNFNFSSKILKKIEMVGNNLAYGQGMCGSVSGSLCTNVGQPAIKVSEITVGGRK